MESLKVRKTKEAQVRQAKRKRAWSKIKGSQDQGRGENQAKVALKWHHMKTMNPATKVV